MTGAAGEGGPLNDRRERRLGAAPSDGDMVRNVRTGDRGLNCHTPGHRRHLEDRVPPR